MFFFFLFSCSGWLKIRGQTGKYPMNRLLNGIRAWRGVACMCMCVFNSSVARHPCAALSLGTPFRQTAFFSDACFLCFSLWKPQSVAVIFQCHKNLCNHPSNLPAMPSYPSTSQKRSAINDMLHRRQGKQVQLPVASYSSLRIGWGKSWDSVVYDPTNSRGLPTVSATGTDRHRSQPGSSFPRVRASAAAKSRIQYVQVL